MNEPEADPQAADVRPFLPRPGEPAEAYAARLRALHRDLTLVLDAVERGLAASSPPPVERPRAPASAPAPARALEPALAGESVGIPVVDPVSAERPPDRREPGPGAPPRVEVVPRRRFERGEGWGGPMGQRAGDAGAEEAAGVAPPSPAPASPARPPVAEPFPPWPPGPAPSPPWQEPPAPPREWQEPPAPPRDGFSPVLLAALVAGWLAALALLVVLLVGM